MDKFIKTTDKETAEKLKAEGLYLFSEQNGMFTFINNGKKVEFDKTDKLVFSNKLEL